MNSIGGSSHLRNWGTQPSSNKNRQGIDRPRLIRSVGICKLEHFVRSYFENPNDFQIMPEGDKNYIISLSVSDKENIDYLTSDPDVNFRVQEIYNRYYKVK